MSATGLEVFDKTLQTTHIWLDEIMAEVGPDRRLAWKLLATVLQVLRDRLPVGLAAHFGAQLPLLVRGVYYDHFQPARQPAEWDSADALIGQIVERLHEARQVDPEEALKIVLGVISRNVTPGQLIKVKEGLPRDIRLLWDGAEARQLAAVDVDV
jgi:uncharacterized protein (DUF2267 family)